MNVWNNLLGIPMKEINHVRFRTFEAKIYYITVQKYPNYNY